MKSFHEIRDQLLNLGVLLEADPLPIKDVILGYNILKDKVDKSEDEIEVLMDAAEQISDNKLYGLGEEAKQVLNGNYIKPTNETTNENFTEVEILN